jgi:hypothetical protein
MIKVTPVELIYRYIDFIEHEITGRLDQEIRWELL